VEFQEPVTITRYGREPVVMLSVAAYRKMRRRYRESLAVDDPSEEQIDAISRAEMSPEHSALDEELS
jgi:PHD/YefM family antitoxin component YafN of YafNO toxin-antitoxin module